MNISNYLKTSYPGHENATPGEFFGMFARLTPAAKASAFVDYCKQNPYGEYPVRVVVECLYSNAVRFALAPGAPAFNAIKQIDSAPQTFGKISKTLSFFIEGAHEFVRDDAQREMMFIRALEGMPEIDAQLLLAIKDRDEAFLGMSAHFALTVCPAWVPGLKLSQNKPELHHEPEYEHNGMTSTTATVQFNNSPQPAERKKPGPKPKAKLGNG